MSPHLDAARWAALQATRDDALLEHLASGCEACDAFLAALPGADGDIDRVLLSLAPRAPSTDELAWARFRRRQQQPARRARVFAAAAALVALVAGGLLWRAEPPVPVDPWTGLKGSGQDALELRAAVKGARGALTPIDDGQAVSSAAALVFQVRSPMAGPARLFIQRGDGLPVELTQLGLVQGAQELERGDEGLLGFSLAGERGPVSVWLVAAEVPMSVDTALDAIKAGGDAGVVVAKLRVDVTP